MPPRTARTKKAAALQMHQRQFFNLATEPWIDVLDEHGQRQSVSLTTLLTDCQAMKDLAVFGPLQRAAMWRFLISVAQEIVSRAGASSQDVDLLLTNGSFEPTEVSNFLARHSERLWLVHPSNPFAQTLRPEHFVREQSSIQALYALIVDVPGPSSRAWFTRSADVPNAMGPAEIAIELLGRWFYGLSGKGSEISAGGVKCDRVSGGRAFWGGRQITHAFRKGSSVFNTLIGNLIEYPSKSVHNALFTNVWLGAEGAVVLHGDPLLSYTVTGTGALLVDDESGLFSAVATGPVPMPKEDAKAALANYQPNPTRGKHDGPHGWRDPHRISYDITVTTGNSSQLAQTMVNLGGDFDDFRELHGYATAIASNNPDSVQVSGVANPNRLAIGLAAFSVAPDLEILSVKTGGTGSSPIYSDARMIRQRSEYFNPDPQLAAAIKDTLDQVFGDKRVLSRLLKAVWEALKSPGDASAGAQRVAKTMFLHSVDAVTSDALDQVAKAGSKLSEGELSQFERELASAALRAFDVAVAPMNSSPRFVGQIVKARQHLLSTTAPSQLNDGESEE